MKFNASSLPNDPEQLKQMLLELQQRMDEELAQKDNELVEKDVAYQQLLERYNLKLANEYGKKSERMPGADEVFNEVELVLDEHDKKLLTKANADAPTKIKPKRKPLPQALPRKEVVVDIIDADKVCDCCQSPLHKMGESSSEALEFVPAHIKVIKTIRPKYTCRQCERNGIESVVKTAVMPDTQKYCDT